MTDFYQPISLHFTLGEFCRGQFAEFNRLDAWGRTKAITNFGKVAHQLEIIRKELAEPIYVTSGWRSKQHNKDVAGAVNSDHMTGLAVDFMTKHTAAKELFEFCRILQGRKMIGFDQLIGYRAHVHIGMGSRMRGDAWTTDAR